MQDTLYSKTTRVVTAMDQTEPGRPHSTPRYHQEELPSVVPTVVGIPVSKNQFNVLTDSKFAVSQNQVQEKDRLVNSRSARFQRLQAAKTEGQGILLAGELSNNVPLYSKPTFFDNCLSVSPTEILNVYSVGNFELGTDELVNAMYNEYVNDVTCINLNWNKKISDAGPERSAERLDNRSIGARSVARAPIA